ncbi:MAG: hypothetical protein WAN44_18110 [Propionibacteriaceae bacterium]
MDVRLVCEIGFEHYGPDELPQNAVLHRIEQKHLQVGSAFGLSQWIVASNEY